MRGGARKGQVDREIGRGWGKRVRYRQSGEEGKMRRKSLYTEVAPLLRRTGSGLLSHEIFVTYRRYNRPR